MRPRGRLIMLCADGQIEAHRIGWILAQCVPNDVDVNPAVVSESPRHVVRAVIVFSERKGADVNKEMLEWLLEPWAALLPDVPVLYLSPDPSRPPVTCSAMQKLDDMAGLIEALRMLGARKRGPKRDSGRVSSSDGIALNQQSNLA